MRNQLVQFLCIDTPLNTKEFIGKLEQFTRSVTDCDIILQQSKKNGGSRYIVQQRCRSNQFQFVFEKRRRSSKTPEAPIKVEQAGGYSILQLSRNTVARPGESKLFAFLLNPAADLDLYRNIPVPNKLNIYQAYFENCCYAYILEFFTKDHLSEKLLQELKQYSNDEEPSIYKQCLLQLS